MIKPSDYIGKRGVLRIGDDGEWRDAIRIGPGQYRILTTDKVEIVGFVPFFFKPSDVQQVM